eukprot:CAMPEP_0180519462 /NCGR_PEP_ID=MMETSP1036_2-20121128/55702_1 /TAXON_ID=632150 /ORGANISM="Azadinium spinosum, Strain 3D9" /LENGTH=167 /DNA_ID=CAMNT_0022531805 /DNA_START=21 /DNA_END=520 /DNA_ORIENTATION=-
MVPSGAPWFMVRGEDGYQGLRSGWRIFAASLRTDFQDFLQYDYITPDNHYISWGHAFFHHAPREAEDRAAYNRRFERFRSLKQDRAGGLLFVRSANATHEMRSVAELHDLLMKRFGPAVQLLFILDHQPSDLPIFFEDRPGLMIHTLGDHRCRNENYSIESPPIVAA